MSTLREDVHFVTQAALAEIHPRRTLKSRLAEMRLYGGRIRVLSIGKAAWSMAQAASEALGTRMERGLVVTPYGKSWGNLPRFTLMEAGYPTPDENSMRAADAAIELAQDLGVEDTMVVLLSGGGSALFEKPLIPLPLYATTTNALLHCGASLSERNMIRKRLSAVKGGRYARLCAPAGVVGFILSDVLDDAVEVIASGPISPDPVTALEAEHTLARVLPDAPDLLRALMRRETPKSLPNAETHVISNVTALVRATQHALLRLGYETIVLTDRLTCDACEAGRFLSSIALSHQSERRSVAYVVGGETVRQEAEGIPGGRNQDLALAAVQALDGLRDTALFSMASDGADGDTDAAGGFVDHRSAGKLRAAGIDLSKALKSHESYHALRSCDGLLFTGPTGTNVNDVAAVMIRR